jgi:glycopeptide antibiotics resistance protein
LIFGFFLLATTPFHLQMERFLLSFRGLNLIEYILLGIMFAFLLIAIFKAFMSKKEFELTGILLAALVLCHLVFQRRLFLNTSHFALFLHVAEFFLLGLIVAKENKKIFSLLPFLILAFFAVVFEYIQKIIPGRIFDMNDIWLNALAGLVGLAIGYF